MKPSAFMLCPEAPYPPHGGGPLRTASLVQYLGQRYDLDLAVFRQPGAEDPRLGIPHGLVRNITVIDLPRHAKHLGARAARNLMRLLRGRPPLTDRFSGFGSEIGNALAGRHYDLAVLEHAWCAPYIEQIRPHADNCLLDLHNVESVLHSRCAVSERLPRSFAHRRFAPVAARDEARWLPAFDRILVASQQDAASIRALAPKVAAHVYPNAIPLAPEPLKREEHVIAFSGNLEYHPNVAAVRFFLSMIWPRLKERFPELRFRLIGKNAESLRKLASDDRIEFTGPLRDSIDALASSKLVVVPLLAGSGTRVKILEAWAAGRAVVSTSIGAEGLGAADGEHLVLADQPLQFAEAVSMLLRQEHRRRKLGASGRRLYERMFTWEAAWQKLEEIGI